MPEIHKSVKVHRKFYTLAWKFSSAAIHEHGVRIRNSIRTIAAVLNIPHKRVFRILKNNLTCTFCIHQVQRLEPKDKVNTSSVVKF